MTRRRRLHQNSLIQILLNPQIFRSRFECFSRFGCIVFLRSGRSFAYPESVRLFQRNPKSSSATDGRQLHHYKEYIGKLHPLFGGRWRQRRRRLTLLHSCFCRFGSLDPLFIFRFGFSCPFVFIPSFSSAFGRLFIAVSNMVWEGELNGRMVWSLLMVSSRYLA